MRAADHTSGVSLTLEALEPRLLLSFTYDLTDLGLLDGNQSYAEAINEAGHVVGYTNDTTTSQTRAFLWTPEAGIQDLGGPSHLWTEAFDINDSDQVVGGARAGAVGTRNAFIWSETTGYREIHLPGGYQGTAHGINNLGQVVGWIEDTGLGRELGFIWEDTSGDGWAQDHEFTYLTALPGDGDVRPYAINDAGQVVGRAVNAAAQWVPFFYEGGMILQLPTRGGTSSEANDLNSLGQVVATTMDATDVKHAYLWTYGATQYLGTLGGEGSSAYGVNDSGYVVGSSYTSEDHLHGFIFTQDERMVEIEREGSSWHPISGQDINETGQIAATGIIGGNLRACLLNPLAPDLTGEYGLIAGPLVPVPGDDVEINLNVINRGFAAADGEITIRIYASTDTVIDAGDLLLTGVSGKSINIAAGASKMMRFPAEIPADMPPGNYHVLTEIDAEDDFDEPNERNNVVSTNVRRTVVWAFGDLGDRKNVKLTVADDLGREATFSLKGGGSGLVQKGSATSGFWRVSYLDTTAKSTAKITTPRGSEININEILIALGPMKSLTAKTTNLGAHMLIQYSLSKLTLGDVSSADIGIVAAGVDIGPLTMVVDRVSDSSMLCFQAIKSFTATEWLDTGARSDLLSSSKWIGKVTIKGDRRRGLAGDFEADLDVLGGSVPAGKPVLGSAKIAGDMLMAANWDITGDVGKVAIAGEVNDWTASIHSDLKSLKVGRLYTADLAVDGAVGTIQAGDWLGGRLDADSVKSIKIAPRRGLGTGNWGANLTLHGALVAPGKSVLKSAKLASDVIGCDWEVTGPVGSIAAGNSADDWNVTLNGSIKSLKLGQVDRAVVTVMGGVGTVRAVEWLDGGLVVTETIKSIKITGDRRAGIAGDFGPILSLGGLGLAAGEVCLSKMNVAGCIRSVTFTAGADLGAITAGALEGTYLLLGFDVFLDPWPGTELSLKSLTLKGMRLAPADPFDSYFVDGKVAAWTIGTFKFQERPNAADGIVKFHELGRLINEPLAAGPGITWEQIP